MKMFLVAVSLLVGGTSAWAESQIFTEDFADETYNVTWGGTSAGGTSPAVADGALKVANGSQSGDRSAYVAFGSNAYTGCCRLTFDMGMTKSGWSGKNNYFHVLPSATTARYPDTASSALSVTQDFNGEITIAGESIGTYNGTMLTYDLYLNTVTHTAKVIVKNGETTLKTISYETTATGINTFNLQFNKNFGAFAIDNISFYSLTAPAFTLSDNSKNVSVDGSETVNVTSITGDVSVVSNNSSVANASYNAGVITINGVASGVTTLTVTATNDELTIEKDIEVTVGAVAKTNITVNYLCGGSSIAEAATIEDVTIGSTLTLSDITYSETLYGTGCRYANPSFSVDFPYTVEEDGVINISYTQQNSVSTLNIYGSVAGNNYLLHTYDLDGKYVGDAVAVTYPEYYVLNGTIYSTGNKQFSGSDFYSGSFTLTGTDPVLTYNSIESNVVYFSEAENIVGGTENASGNANIRCSDAKGAFFTSATNVVTLPAGRYTINTQVWGNTGATFTFKAGENTICEHSTTGALNPKSQEFTLTSPATITVIGGSSGKVLDLVYIVRTGDATVTKTITAAGWATYCSSYALDFTGDIANLTDVYIVTGANANSLVLSSVKGGTVPANTGLLLEGTAGDVVIPIAGSSTTNVDANKLVGVTAETELAANGGYVLMRTPKVGFYQNANAFTVGANTAYLPIDFDVAILARDFYSFGEATGIGATLKNKEIENKEVYNLKGQRVAAPQKGLYIVNGKKVVVK